MEEQRNNPIPLLIVSGVLGYLLGNVWIGLAVGFGLTIVPFVSMLGLVLNNLILRAVEIALMVIGFPFFLIGRGIWSLLRRDDN